MLFNTLEFAIFFVIVYVLYLSLSFKRQNRMLLVASYIFYGAWNWKFLSLILISTMLDYYCSLSIHESENTRKRNFFLALSIIGNLSILGFFKYFNFFAASLHSLLAAFGFSVEMRLLHIILPVGISFYTFQTLSYTIDVYKKQMEPTRKFLDFALFVSFFPQLVAGPIERAKHLLPQILLPRTLSPTKFYEGCYLVLWGLFMKIFVGDNLARMVNPVFAGTAPYAGINVLLALYAFAFQIYCDFAGYSNIARGLGKMMGFDIMVNFNLPYISTNPREFWQRWHISLSTWLRDYLYIPLGGNRRNSAMTYRNLAITMLLGGLWHGAAWTFVLWGAYQGVLLIIHRLSQPVLAKIPSPKNFFINKIWFLARVIFFFHITCLGWLIFRAQSLKQVFDMLKALFGNFIISGSLTLLPSLSTLLYYLWLLLLIEYVCYKKNDFYAVFRWPVWARSLMYIVMYFLFLSGVKSGQEFIYFQF